jgi:subtilisin family serine protease
MTTRQHRVRFTGLLVATSIVTLLVWGLTRGLPAGEAGGGPSVERARALVAEARGLPLAQLTVARVAPFADTGIVQFKLIDGDGNIIGIDLDASGNPVSPEEIKNHGRRVDNRGFVGKLDAALHEQISKNPNAPVRFVCLLDVPTNGPLRGNGVTDQEYAANLQDVAAQVAQGTKPVWDKVRAGGGQVLYESTHAPFGICEGSGQLVRNIAADPRVKRIFLERTHQERLDVSRVVVQANTVNARGFSGVGQRVAVVESGRIAGHTDLPAGQRVNCNATFNSLFAGVSGHKTNVGGVIQSNNLTFRGIAPGITIVDGIGFDFSDAEMTAATDCVIDSQGAVAVNMSFGSETNGVFDAFARFVDRKVVFTGRTIVPAISNVCANRMGSPEIAFNALAVGAFGDNNTTGFGDDIPACTGAVFFSAFLNPLSPSSDRELPNVVAPGLSITTTNSAGGFSAVNGTSFAAPHVTAGVGLLVQRDPSLATQVERVRAIMMTAARHNIEGASRLSDRDGAGAIMLAASDGVLLDVLSSFFTTPGGTTGFPITRTFTAFAGQRVRVAIAWSHKSPEGDTLTRPTTDLDLRVTTPIGTSFFSGSFDNTYEIVDFIAPATGTYTATISNFRSSAGTEFIGFAASRIDF